MFLLGGRALGKPSIFSREYDRKMKVRKRRRTVLLFCLIAVAVYYVGYSTYTNWQDNYLKNKSKDSNGYLTNKTPEKVEDTTKEEPEKDKEQSPAEAPHDDKFFDVKMPNGRQFKLIYTEENGIKTIKNVVSEENGLLFFNISPSATKVVILDIEQEMYIADLTGSVKNISKTEYITTGGTRIDKTSYLKRKPEFQWHSTPKFINETTVVYASQMPWFATKKSVYKVDINTSTHQKIPSLTGENLSFDVLEEKGLKVNVDGNIKFISKEGTVVQ